LQCAVFKGEKCQNERKTTHKNRPESLPVTTPAEPATAPLQRLREWQGVHLKNELCQIDPNGRNVHPGRSCWFK
jgi:hypothetical protein